MCGGEGGREGGREEVVKRGGWCEEEQSLGESDKNLFNTNIN